MNCYDVIRIMSHLSCVFRFCSIFASCHNNKLKRTDLINKLKFGLDYCTGMHLKCLNLRRWLFTSLPYLIRDSWIEMDQDMATNLTQICK